ncbi:hypothetical protein [Microbacterium sp.]|uniref:hypothetical protein n=1 Tax=Microbacterium sp. TaxID=51671 RepID=UPI003F6F3339
MASKKHLIAVNRAIRAAHLDEKGLDAPMIELIRDLARQMDACEGPAPVRLQGNYLSATKDLARAARAARAIAARQPTPATPTSGPSGPPALALVEDPPKNELEKFRDKHLAG